MWENEVSVIVLDGIYYALALAAAGGLITWAAGPWFAAPLWILAAFCLYFFRDPERAIPAGRVAVSPADGKVVAVKAESADAQPHQHLSEHFRRAREPHAHRRRDREGAIPGGQVSCGQPRRVFGAERAERGHRAKARAPRVVFKQIAGLIARRIVFRKKPGDHVATGERIGLIKFGSRVDVLFGPEWEIVVQPGQRVSAGSSVIARRIADGRGSHGA